jgi:hypothetical protein
MAADLWHEDARGIWQSQESVVIRMPVSEMRARADRWNREFDGTSWIPFACAGVILLFFALMLAINQTALQRLGALIGIGSAAYLARVGLRVSGRRWVDEGSTCVRAYKAQLERRWQADMGSARTILMVMTGCALLSSPGEWVPWTLQIASQLGTGIVVYIYIARQARRFRVRINELTRLERD